jgi:hypothetical protein
METLTNPQQDYFNFEEPVDLNNIVLAIRGDHLPLLGIFDIKEINRDKLLLLYDIQILNKNKGINKNIEIEMYFTGNDYVISFYGEGIITFEMNVNEYMMRLVVYKILSYGLTIYVSSM